MEQKVRYPTLGFCVVQMVDFYAVSSVKTHAICINDINLVEISAYLNYSVFLRIMLYTLPVDASDST